MPGLTTHNQSGTPEGDAHQAEQERESAPREDPKGPSEQLIEPENPNEVGERNPGDPTVSLDPDGTPANEPAPYVATAPINPAPDTTQSDPAHVPSPYQQGGDIEILKENARLREAALQAENRLRVDRTPNAEVDLTPHVDLAPEPAPQPNPVWDPVAQVWR